MQLRSPIFRHFVISAAFVSLYLLLNWPEVIVLAHLGSVAWYPATGLSLAVMLGISPWYAFVVSLADVLAGALIYHQPLHSFGETLGAAGVGACYAGAAFILRGPLAIDPGLRRRQDVARFVFVTMAAAVGATVIGVACLAGDNTIPWSRFVPTAGLWFLGDLIGLVGIAPFLLVHVLPRLRPWAAPSAGPWHGATEPVERPSRKISAAAVLEALGQAAAIAVTLWVVFGPTFGDLELTYLCLVPIIWMAMRQGIRRVVVGSVALNFGIVAAMRIYSSTHLLLVEIGFLMLAVSAVGLITGSAVTERHRASVELQEQTFYLNSLIENSPLGLVVLDPQGKVEMVNPAFEKLLLYDQHELVGSQLDAQFLPGEENSGSLDLLSQVSAGKILHRTLRGRRKDGKTLDLEVHAVPLSVEGRVRGAYTIYNDISEQIKAAEGERKHAESLGELVHELQLRTRQMTLLNEMGDLLECCGTVQEASVVVSQSVQKLFPDAASGALYLFKPSRNLLEAAGKWGKLNAETVFTPDECWALRRGRPHWNESGDDAIRCPHLAEDSTSSCLCVPLVGRGDTLGVLRLSFTDDDRAPRNAASGSLRDSRQQLAATVSGQVALSLSSLRLRETLRDQSIRDPLTGLFNRRFMEESLERELQRGARKSHPVSVLYLDLDHFKGFNDAFGHDAGDLVLRAIADLLANFFRSDDVCCRFGGEEFGVILPEAPVEHAAFRANALRAEVKRLKLQYKNQALGMVTLSIGVAAFPQHATTGAELLKVADQCLYQSKAAGRDAVTVADSPGSVSPV